MAQFKAMVLAYLEHEQPKEYARLKQERKLLEQVNALVDQLYEETDRVLARLKQGNAGASDEALRLEAERIAAETLLPTGLVSS